MGCCSQLARGQLSVCRVSLQFQHLREAGHEAQTMKHGQKYRHANLFMQKPVASADAGASHQTELPGMGRREWIGQALQDVKAEQALTSRHEKARMDRPERASKEQA